MKPADKIVEALLESDDPKDFLDRQGADLHRDTILDKITRAGISPEQIDGVEAYGMIVDDGEEIRTDAGDELASKWGISLHTIDSNKWMVDYDDYNTPEDALHAATVLHSFLQEMFPHLTIHFIDEISPP